MTKKNLNYFLILFSVGLLTFMMYYIIKPNNDEMLPKNEAFTKTPITDTFSFATYLDHFSGDSLQGKFPYQAYLKSNRYQDIYAIRSDLAYLERQYGQNGKNSEYLKVLYISLSDSLLRQFAGKYEKFDADEYIRLLQWAECFKYIALYEPKGEMLYSSVYDYWVNFIAIKLTEFSNLNSNVKYDFKFRLLKAKLMEKGYTFSVKISSFDKFVFNITGNHWGHLIDSTWNQTSVIQKLLFGFVALFSLFSYIISCIYIINKIKK
jgi:hypothetical protein